MAFQSTNVWSRSWNHILDGTFAFVVFCGLMVVLSLINNFVMIVRKKSGYVSGKSAALFFLVMPLVITATLALEMWWRINAFYGVSTFYVSYWWHYLAFSIVNYGIILVIWLIKAHYTKKFKAYKNELIEIKSTMCSAIKKTSRGIANICTWPFKIVRKIFKKTKRKPKVLDLVQMPVEGKIIDLKKVGDRAFAQGHLGKGIGIKPTLKVSVLTAPITGEVITIFNTLHAYGIKSKNGTHALVHIGFNTTKLKGKHFKAMQKVGSRVSAGDPVIKADFKKIQAAGYDITTVVVCTPETKGKANILTSKINKQGNLNTIVMKIT